MSTFQNRPIKAVVVHQRLFVGGTNFEARITVGEGERQAKKFEVVDGFVLMTGGKLNQTIAIPLANVSQIDLGQEIKKDEKNSKA